MMGHICRDMDNREKGKLEEALGQGILMEMTKDKIFFKLLLSLCFVICGWMLPQTSPEWCQRMC